MILPFVRDLLADLTEIQSPSVITQ